jgi:F-type H+-transporting ATPase subunit b
MIIASAVPTVLAAEEDPLPIIPVLGEVIIAFIAFGVVCFLLMKYIFPRMEETFRARVDAIEGGIKRAEEAQAEANGLLEQYRAQLAEARTEAAQIRDEARAEGLRIIEDLRTEAHAESARIVQRGEEQLRAERESLVAELRRDVGRVAVELASRIVGESLADEARRAGTVERFLAEIEAEGAAPATGRR